MPIDVEIVFVLVLLLCAALLVSVLYSLGRRALKKIHAVFSEMLDRAAPEIP